jgi:hypothetical protein
MGQAFPRALHSVQVETGRQDVSRRFVHFAASVSRPDACDNRVKIETGIDLGHWQN